MKSRYLLGMTTALLLVGGQSAFAASCAGGEPDIQNPVPNCGIASPIVTDPSAAIFGEHLRTGRSVAVDHYRYHEDQGAD